MSNKIIYRVVFFFIQVIIVSAEIENYTTKKITQHTIIYMGLLVLFVMSQI